jgi:DNA-directed RNA polymerase specialized sigma24 family protein
MTRSEYGCAYEEGFCLTVNLLVSRGVPVYEAEETAQAAWTRGWERIDQLRDAQFVRTWVNSIALNLHRRTAQLDSRKRPLEDLSGHSDVDVAAIDLTTLLRSCCSSDQALLLHQLHGLSTREMAQAVGTTEIAVRVRLARAKRSVRSIAELRRAGQKAA